MGSYQATDFPTILLMLRPHVLQFKITLVGIFPPVWRRIQVPSDYSFFALHSAIQDVMGWEDRFSFQFDRISRRPEVVYIRAPLPTYDHDYFVKHYFWKKDDTARYVYHFVHQWEFKVLLENITEAVEGVGYPRCVGGDGGSPPEVMGGPKAFQTHLDMAMDSDDASKQDMIEVLSAMDYTHDFNRESVVFKNPRVRFDRPMRRHY